MIEHRLISEKDVIEKFAEIQDLRTLSTATIGKVLKECPTIDAEPVRHGKWIMRGGKLYCSECNEKAGVTRDSEDFWYTKGTDRCPSCGAKMNKEI